jgi:hypothetical protein
MSFLSTARADISRNVIPMQHCFSFERRAGLLYRQTGQETSERVAVHHTGIVSAREAKALRSAASAVLK